MALLRIGSGETKDVTVDELSKTTSFLMREDPCCGLSFCEEENCIELNLRSGKKIKIACRSMSTPRWFDRYFSVEVDVKN